MLDSVSMRALHTALDGLAARQRVISDDIANVNTPFYTAHSVAFEDNLRSAVSSGENPADVQPVTSDSSDPYNLAYNNVNLDNETVLSAETELRYDLALRATGDRFSLLNIAAKGA
jgi:flagellar basal-body rod protein FlgB